MNRVSCFVQSVALAMILAMVSVHAQQATVPVQGTTGLSPLVDGMAKIYFLGIRSVEFQRELIDGQLACEIELEYDNQNDFKVVISKLEAQFLCIDRQEKEYNTDLEDFSMAYHDFFNEEESGLTPFYKRYYSGTLVYPKDSRRKTFVFEKGKRTVKMMFVLGAFYAEASPADVYGDASKTLNRIVFERLLGVSNVINGHAKDKAKLVLLAKGVPNYYPTDGVVVPLGEQKVAVVMERAPNDYLLTNKHALKALGH